jgi:hypothetical protein
MEGILAFHWFFLFSYLLLLAVRFDKRANGKQTSLAGEG